MPSKVGKNLHTNKQFCFSYLSSYENLYNYSKAYNRVELTEIKVCNYFEQATCLAKFHTNPDLNDYAHKLKVRSELNVVSFYISLGVNSRYYIKISCISGQPFILRQ